VRMYVIRHIWHWSVQVWIDIAFNDPVHMILEDTTGRTQVM